MADLVQVCLADVTARPPRVWRSPLVWLAAHPEVGLRVGRMRGDWLGAYDPNAHEILLNEHLSPNEVFDTLAHEIVHAIRRDHGDHDGNCGDEDQVDALAQAMFGPYRCSHCTAAKAAS